MGPVPFSSRHFVAASLRMRRTRSQREIDRLVRSTSSKPLFDTGRQGAVMHLGKSELAYRGHHTAQQIRLRDDGYLVLVCQQIVRRRFIEAAVRPFAVYDRFAKLAQPVDQPALRFFMTEEATLAKSGAGADRTCVACRRRKSSPRRMSGRVWPSRPGCRSLHDRHDGDGVIPRL